MLTTLRKVERSIWCVACLSFSAGALAQDVTLTVGTPVPLPPETEVAESAVAADLNGDELLDIIVGRNFSSTLIFYNNGTSNPFENVPGEAIPGDDPQQEAYVADMNGDGHLDILAVGFNSPTKLYLNDGTSMPFAGVTGTDINPGSTDSTTALAIADVNADGHPDVALASTNQYVNRLILNNGTADPFAGSSVLDIGVESGWADGIALADVNGDGLPDAIVAYDKELIGPSGLLIYLNNGTNDPFGGVSPNTLMEDETAWNVEAADVNNDGRPDLIVVGPLQNVVYLHTGSDDEPYDEPIVLEPSGVASDCVSSTVVRIDSDPFPDLVIGCSFRADDPEPIAVGAIYLNDGTASAFAGVVPTDIPMHDGAYYNRSVRVVDFTGSGELSLLTAEWSAKITPLHVNQHPVASDDSFAISAGESIEVDVLANDSDADGTLDRSAIEIIQEPSHGTTLLDAQTQLITYQSDSDFVGEDTLQYRVRDNEGGLSRVATATFHVQGAPLAIDDVAPATSGVVVSIDVLANDSSPGGSLDAATLTISSAPAHGTATVVPGSFVIEYQSAAGFLGTDILEYTIADNLGVVSSPATVTFHVQGVPLASHDVASTTSGVVVIIDVLANDSSPGGSLDAATLTISSPPANGTATVVPGSFVIEYRSAANFSGTDVFEYTIADNLGVVSAPATVSVAVSRPTPPPATNPGGSQGGGGGGGSFNVLLLTALGLLRFLTWRQRAC